MPKPAEPEAGPEANSFGELVKHIDPRLSDDLRKLQDEGLTRLQVTVVFWDISSFSSLCKDLFGFEDSIYYFLNLYFKKAIEIIKEHSGVLRLLIILIHLREIASFLGSTLNFASRLEALAWEDEIIVSKELKNMIEEKYKFRKILVKDRMPDKIKSYEEVDVVYALERKSKR